MQVGDKVIINPNIPDKAWSKYGYGFYHDTMRRPGIFVLEKEYHNGGFEINGYIYDEEWLLPVPLFKVGDKVKIKEDLSVGDDVPYGVSSGMEKLAGSCLIVEEVKVGKRNIDLKLGDDGCLYELKEKGYWNWSSPMFDISNYKLKIKSNESRLQKQESPLRGGSGEIKCGICCRKHKPRVTVKPVGYKKVFGRG